MLIRFFDILFSLIAILLLLPIYLMISILIFFQMNGPIFFVQNRVTKNQNIFRFYKFRTMITLKDVNKGDSHNYLKMNLEDLRLVRDEYKTTKSGDSRVTFLGKFLRKTSLDEIPQIFSVLLGHMSLVGPRPDPPIQRADYEDYEWKKRCTVKSGITGYSQINGRSELDSKDRISNDLYWADNISLIFYFKILLLTPVKMFKNVT